MSDATSSHTYVLPVIGEHTTHILCTLLHDFFRSAFSADHSNPAHTTRTYAPQAGRVHRNLRTPLEYSALEGELRGRCGDRGEFRRRGRSRRSGEQAQGILRSDPQDRYGVVE